MTNTDKKATYITDVYGVSHLVCPADRIPTDDPDLPSYLCSDYRANAEKLDLVRKVFNDEVSCFLPRWNREPMGAYKDRVERTKYVANNAYKAIVSGFPGLLSSLDNKENLYEKLLENEENIDLRGNSLHSVVWQIDLDVIDSGCVGVLVEMPQVDPDDDSSDEPRGYLVPVDRRDILSWNLVSDGCGVFERVTIRRCIERPVGLYGTETITTFRTFFDDGSWRSEVICLVKKGQGEEYISVLVDYGESTLKEVPLVIYSATSTNPLTTPPPLYNVAKLNVGLYQLLSEARDIIHKLNLPVAVREGAINNAGETPPPMILGSNTGIDVVKGGKFYFVSPDSSVLETDREEMATILQAMQDESLRFLSGSSGTQKTATEALLSSSQIQATMAGIARLKTSFLQEINRKWAAYYGVEIDHCDISVNQDLLKLPIDAQTLSALSGMVSADQLSVITLLEVMKEGLRLPDGVIPSLEIKRIAAQQTLRHKQARDDLAYQSQLNSQVNQQNNQQQNSNGNFGNNQNRSSRQ